LNADLLRRARLQAGRRRKVLRAFVRITQVQKQVAMDAFREGVAAAHHPIQPSGKIGQNWRCHFSCTFLPRSGD
jgi:hypothetical protein